MKVPSSLFCLLLFLLFHVFCSKCCRINNIAETFSSSFKWISPFDSDVNGYFTTIINDNCTTQLPKWWIQKFNRKSWWKWKRGISVYCRKCNSRILNLTIQPLVVLLIFEVHELLCLFGHEVYKNCCYSSSTQVEPWK